MDCTGQKRLRSKAAEYRQVEGERYGVLWHEGPLQDFRDVGTKERQMTAAVQNLRDS